MLHAYIFVHARPCAGYPRKPAMPVPQSVDGRITPGTARKGRPPGGGHERTVDIAAKQ
jgi:hypothetical protein